MKPGSPRTTIGRDLLGFCVLAAISLAVGVLANQYRQNPLPLVYLSKAERLNHAVAKVEAAQVTEASPPTASSGVTATSPAPLPVPAPKSAPAEIREIDLDEFRRLLDEPQAVVVDARPEIFHRFGHVPKALALPRDDFETYYKKHRTTLEPCKTRTVLIYCSGSACEDSHLVANALDRLGYQRLAILTGGWNQWTQQRLPEEK